MNQSTLKNKLDNLGLYGMRKALMSQAEDASYSHLSFEDRLSMLLEAEDAYQKEKRIALNLKFSKIKDKQATIESIDYGVARNINRGQILSLAQLGFIAHRQNVIITGKTGTGKSHIAQALANKAIREGMKAYYVRTSLLLEEIKIAKASGTYTNLLRKYSKCHLLILDDFAMTPLCADEATAMFEIIEDRTELNSTIITSQLPVSEWYGILNNPTVADALLDRIVHSSHRIELEGESIRKTRAIKL